MHVPDVLNRSCMPQGVRTFATSVETPAAAAVFAKMNAGHDSRMATAQESINELMVKIQAESKTQSSEGGGLASALQQFDGAVRTSCPLLSLATPVHV